MNRLKGEHDRQTPVDTQGGEEVGREGMLGAYVGLRSTGLSGTALPRLGSAACG